MMGKAMQNQVDVLQRVGITFDESQKQVLQFGTESERAAMLAEVITATAGTTALTVAVTALYASLTMGIMEEYKEFEFKSD